LAKTTFGTPEYALVTFYRAIIFQYEGNIEAEKYNLALSAISDIRSAIKDHASLWMLTQILFNEGDMDRAYTYIRFSWNETVFYNAKLRSLQTAGILSLIDRTYQIKIERQNQALQNSLIRISILSLLFLAALIYIYLQMKKLSATQNNLQVANNRLKELNEELQQMNVCLQTTNLELIDSNRIKEEYIGRFIKLCSTYINKLEAYRRMVNKKITAGRIAELLKTTRSQDTFDEELKELHTNFDATFLHLFPDFVNRFNELLQKDDPIILKKGELLNTELRIFALIRLGIDDSSQIAEFLHYSVNTIYNYRAKVKNRAGVSRDNFEKLVKTIQ
jgi:DNA-binding CsgD family transcriptional regulator